MSIDKGAVKNYINMILFFFWHPSPIDGSFEPIWISANPITVTPIWKWEFANGVPPHYYAYSTLQPYNKIRLHLKGIKFDRKRMLMYKLGKHWQRSSANLITVTTMYNWVKTPSHLQSILGLYLVKRLFQELRSPLFCPCSFWILPNISSVYIQSTLVVSLKIIQP